jgi:SAM-dependent methyltransferase
MWDERYQGEGYLFGTDPARFLTGQAHHLPARSRILCLADGEGRNSVWLAGQGHRVTALEASGVALAKARKLAADRGVSVDFHQADILAGDWPGAPFDIVLGVFIQFLDRTRRKDLHRAIAAAVRPGGLVALHGYAPRQIGYGTGGPSQVQNLYTLDGLRADFPGWSVLHAADYDADIREGHGHAGNSALIDFIAVAPGPLAA